MLPSDIVIEQQVPWEEHDCRAELLVPKFGSDIVGRAMRRILGQRTVRIKLDALGSHVWKKCDGETPLQEIVCSLEQHHGVAEQDARMRIEKFLKRMHHEGWVKYYAPQDRAVQQ